MSEKKTLQPLVSVGIPTYNRPEGLRRTLQLITGQTYKNLEIIVSDNCSPGNDTEKIVREFMEKDQRIQYYRQSENKGAMFNFDFVLKKATGEYFMWAADDDEWDNIHIETIMSYYLNDNTNLLIVTNWRCLNPKGFFYMKQIPSAISNGSNFMVFLKYMLLHHWAYAKACFIYGIFVREVLVECFDDNNVDIDVGNDLVIVYRVIAKGKVLFINKTTWTKKFNYFINYKLYNSFSIKVLGTYFFDLLIGHLKNRGYEIQHYTRTIDLIIEGNWRGIKSFILKILNKLNHLRLICLLYS